MMTDYQHPGNDRVMLVLVLAGLALCGSISLLAMVMVP